MYKVGQIIRFKNEPYLNSIGISPSRVDTVAIIIEIWDEKISDLFPDGKRYWVHTHYNAKNSVKDISNFVTNSPKEGITKLWVGTPGIEHASDVQLGIF